MFFEICQLEGSPIAIALWAAGKAPEKLTPAITGVWTGKSKNTFSGQALKHCFLKFASCKGFPLQLRFGQLEKHLKSSLPAITGVWRGKAKNNFTSEKLFFFEICRLEGSPIAIALWAAGKEPEKLTACYHGCLDGKIKKTTFQPLKSCFFEICQLEGSPIANALWATGKAPEKLTACYHGVSGRENQKNNFSGFEKLFFEICQLEGSPISIALWNVCPVYIVGTGICCCHCVAASFHTDLTKSPRLNSKTYLAPRLSSL